MHTQYLIHDNGRIGVTSDPEEAAKASRRGARVTARCRT
jgi:hypothetical protein